MFISRLKPKYDESQVKRQLGWWYSGIAKEKCFRFETTTRAERQRSLKRIEPGGPRDAVRGRVVGAHDGPVLWLLFIFFIDFVSTRKTITDNNNNDNNL